MAKIQYPRVVLKVGTNVITKESGLLNETVMASIAGQIAELTKRGVTVILVSSGAMGAGRAHISLREKIDDVSKRQLLAAVGQPYLMHTYSELFAKQGISCAQVLATKEDFRDRQHYLNMQSCFEALLKEGILPIVNENDVVAVSELMFSDNDELAGLIASMMGSDTLVILTTVNGVIGDDGTTVLAEIAPASREWKKVLKPEMSSFGRGGMHTKCAIAEKLSLLGIQTHIINGTLPGSLTAVLGGRAIGTAFHPAKQTSSVKRWVAFGEGKEKGSVRINAGAITVITSKDKAASLLPIGITAIEGDFEKGDLIELRDEKGSRIGLGMASYGSARACEVMGKKGEKPLVHYDYLFLST